MSTQFSLHCLSLLSGSRKVRTSQKSPHEVNILAKMPEHGNMYAYKQVMRLEYVSLASLRTVRDQQCKVTLGVFFHHLTYNNDP